MTTPPGIEWFSQLTLATAPPSLQGDKVILPPTVLEQLLAKSSVTSAAQPTYHNNTYTVYSAAARRHAENQPTYQSQNLPHPLTFRIVNPENGRSVYAGIREFSAADDCVALSPFLQKSLEVTAPSKVDAKPAKNVLGEDEDVQELITSTGPKLSVHLESLPKGTFVKLRPLEAGYDPEDWKALLEYYLRSNFTTLTKGEILDVRSNSGETFQFVLDEFKPEGNGICIVDTDLEVDIEALNEDQACETLKRYAAKHNLASQGATDGSSRGGKLSLFKAEDGRVASGEYVDYELPSWPRSEAIEVCLDTKELASETQLDVLVSPFSTRQRNKPREDEHVLADFHDRPSKRIRLRPSSLELDNAESVLISVYASVGPAQESKGDANSLSTYSISVSVPRPSHTTNGKTNAVNNDENAAELDETICPNCKHMVPKQSLLMHESFCRRNNIRCPFSDACPEVFQRGSQALQNHWHCNEGCDYSGSSPATKEHHQHLFHQARQCSNCSYPDPFPSMPVLAEHRVTNCPAKPILCRFCHLSVPQEGNGDDPFALVDAQVSLSGMTAHEVADGARTTECHLCNSIVRLRDMDTHLKNHDFERLQRPLPRICRNVLCARTLDGVSANGDTRAGTRAGQGPGNNVGLCSVCFGPLYASTYDPDGRMLKRRVERKYLTQLKSGCGNSACINEYCRTGRVTLGKKNGQDPKVVDVPMEFSEGKKLAQPFVEGLYSSQSSETQSSLHFCTDQASQERRMLAMWLANEGKDLPGAKQYGLPWCVAALELYKSNVAKAQEWLINYAPSVEEEAKGLRR